MFKKIIFTGDIFRVSSNRFIGRDPFELNIYANYRFFSNYFKDIFDCEIEYLSGNELGLSLNFVQIISKTLHLPLNEDSWAIYYEDSSEFPQIEDAVLNYFDKDILVVGYELPPYLIKIFKKNAISYIDVALHPIRFMPDLILSLRTSNSKIYKKLLNVQVPLESLYDEVQMYKALSARKINLNLKSNSAIFLGQLDVDASLISHKRIQKMDDIVDYIKELSLEFNHVYYKKHPHINAQWHDQLMKQLQGIKNISLLEINIYDLFGQETDATFVAVSSGSLMEAKLFGHKTRRLITENPFLFPSEKCPLNLEIPKYVASPSNLNSVSFWKYVFFGKPFIPRYVKPTESWVNHMINLKWGRK